ncbi:MAG: FkbM family methyltransferase [Flavobacterium sp.]
MRRINILFFWLTGHKNNVSFLELVAFLVKPKINAIAKKHIDTITKKEAYEVKFHAIDDIVYWPDMFSLNRLDQVVAETFDKNDWHYYQKDHTEVENGEIILDIGTAEGLFPMTVIDKCKHIYMIEPGKIFCDCLEKTFVNHKDKITLFNVAVGNENGIIPFDENSIEGKITVENQKSEYKVSINKIDTLLNNNERITYLKADIEGFEVEMLKGAEQTIKRNKPKIAITTYHTQNNPDEIIATIKGYVPEYNYYVKGIYEETPKPVLIHFWI